MRIILFLSLIPLLTAAQPALMGGTLVQFRTRLGTVDVELFDQEKPLTVQNFVRYVRAGAYADSFLHRCLPGFIVQGGGLTTPFPGSHEPFTNYVGVPVFDPVPNEFEVGPLISNTNGTLAMAKVDGDPDSATSQWFFNLGDNSEDLDDQNGGFTVFARVVRDPSGVLNHFNSLNKATANGIIDLRSFNPGNPAIFSDLPVFYSGLKYPNFSELFYVDITLLNVEVEMGDDGERIITWNSVAGRPNHIEFTEGFPPSWQSLETVTGNGGPMEVTDASNAGTPRFYRVRVDY
jgi:cyclophilin family peptidyl-prolyl cis-trans isomerase